MVIITQIVTDCRTMIIEDFEIEISKTSKYLRPPYRSLLQQHITDYLEKLLTQMNIAVKSIQSRKFFENNPKIEEHATKMYTLWKCARRDDMERLMITTVKGYNDLYTAGSVEGALFAASVNSVKKKTKLEVKGTPLELKPAAAQIPLIPIQIVHNCISVFLTTKDGAALAVSCKMAAERVKSSTNHLVINTVYPTIAAQLV